MLESSILVTGNFYFEQLLLSGMDATRAVMAVSVEYWIGGHYDKTGHYTGFNQTIGKGHSEENVLATPWIYRTNFTYWTMYFFALPQELRHQLYQSITVHTFSTEQNQEKN